MTRHAREKKHNNNQQSAPAPPRPAPAPSPPPHPPPTHNQALLPPPGPFAGQAFFGFRKEKKTPPLAPTLSETHSAGHVGIVAQMPSLKRGHAAVPVQASLDAAQTGLTLPLGVAATPRAVASAATRRTRTRVWRRNMQWLFLLLLLLLFLSCGAVLVLIAMWRIEI